MSGEASHVRGNFFLMEVSLDCTQVSSGKRGVEMRYGLWLALGLYELY